MFLFLFFLFLRVDSRWTKPNIYAWLEQNTYICYLELKSPHDLRFLNKDEASNLKCSCGDPLLTQSACARSNNLKRPFCARLPDPCMKAYSVIFKPSGNRTQEKEPVKVNKLGSGGHNQIRPTESFEFFTLAPKVEKEARRKSPQQDVSNFTQEKKLASRKSFSPGRIVQTANIHQSQGQNAENVSKNVVVSRNSIAKVPLIDGEVDHGLGIELFLNNSHVMNRLIEVLVKKMAETRKGPVSIEEKKGSLIKMLSSNEEEAPTQRVVFTESIRMNNDGHKLITVHPQAPGTSSSSLSQAQPASTTIQPEKEPPVLRPDLFNASSLQATASPVTSVQPGPTVPSTPFKITRTRNGNKKRPIFHEALIKLQKQLLLVLGENPHEVDDEDDLINDNDIITIFREHEDAERGKNLAFSDDEYKWTQDVGEGETEKNNLFFKTLPFNPRVCENNHSLCEFWTAYRLCHSHARFMYKYCRRSCGICV